MGGGSVGFVHVCGCVGVWGRVGARWAGGIAAASREFGEVYGPIGAYHYSALLDHARSVATEKKRRLVVIAEKLLGCVWGDGW